MSLANTNTQLPGAVRDINITFNDQTWTAQHIIINRSTTVSLSVFDAQADQLKQNILAIGVAKVIVATSINPKFVGGNIRCGKALTPSLLEVTFGVAKVIVATSINPKFVGGNIRCGKGRLYLDATSGIYFYFDHEVAASQRLFQELYSKPEKDDTTSAKQYHGVKKLEKVSLGELNNYILESPPQALEFLCKAKIASLETTNGWYRVELLVEAGDDKSLFVAFDSAMTKLTGIRATEVVME
uniref:Replication factor A C-terminal domain-containing protein n=1 Tax=Brassica oleracea var. oleracea TaxID=109376 RepID=A0A0D3ARS7_BRAOL